MENHTSEQSIGHSGLEKLLTGMKQTADASFWGFLGGEIKQADGKKVSATLEVKPHHLNLIGILHGGVHATMVDSAMGLAAMLARPDENVVTTNLNMNYLRPVQAGTVTVTAEIVHSSRKMVTAQAQVLDAGGELCALATGTFRVIDRT